MSFRRHHALAAALCFAVFAILAAGLAGLWPLDAADRAVTDPLPALRTPLLNEGMLVVTALGDSRFLIFVAVLTVAALAFARAWKEAAVFGAAFALMPLAVKALKAAIARPRPTVDLYGGVETFSFPSGHATNAALIYGALALLSLQCFRPPRGKFIAAAFAFLALMIAVSRIYLGAHWPSDTLAGLALAGLMLTGIAAITEDDTLPAATRYVPLTLLAVTAAFPLYLFIALPEARDLYTALHAS